jgi:hypothetical protein
VAKEALKTMNLIEAWFWTYCGQKKNW